MVVTAVVTCPVRGGADWVGVGWVVTTKQEVWDLLMSLSSSSVLAFYAMQKGITILKMTMSSSSATCMVLVSCVVLGVTTHEAWWRAYRSVDVVVTHPLCSSLLSLLLLLRLVLSLGTVNHSEVLYTLELTHSRFVLAHSRFRLV